MKKIGIFYGSTTGTTEQIAGQIAKALGVEQDDVYDVAKSKPSDAGDYEVLLFGASTWGDGDLQDDMHDFLDGVGEFDLEGRYVALFGCGDETMTDTFCNGVGEMYDVLVKTGAEMIGTFNADGYDFTHSDAVKDGKAVGLLIDNVNHENLTAGKIAGWTALVKKQASSVLS